MRVAQARTEQHTNLQDRPKNVSIASASLLVDTYSYHVRCKEWLVNNSLLYMVAKSGSTELMAVVLIEISLGNEP